MFWQVPSNQRVALAALGTVLAGFVLNFGAQNVKKPAPIVFSQAAPVGAGSSPMAAVPADDLIVHVAGEVKKPGVYHLKPGSRVADAIRTAGGTTARADLGAWNLAAKVADGDQVYVNAKSVAPAVVQPSAGGSKASHSVKAKPKPLEGFVPLRVDIPEKFRGGASIPLAEQTPAPRGGRSDHPKYQKKAEPAPGSISLNSASETEFQKLPGVGPATAKKIVEYRNAHGSFASVDELLAVKGIGPKKLAAMRKFLRL